MKLLFIALGFLTVFPIPLKWTLKPEDLGRSMAFFPLAGFISGGVLVAVNAVLLLLFPRSLADFVLIAVLALITGGIHLDGLADTCDGLYGGKTREEVLSIMKDSRVGAIGVISLIFVIGIKYTALHSIPEGMKYASLLVMPAISRWSMVLTAYLSPYARPKGGTGKDFVEGVSSLSILIASVFAGVISAGLLGLKGGLLMLSMGGVTLLGVIYFRRRLGGVTGDILGAVNEVTEVLALLFLLVSYGE